MCGCRPFQQQSKEPPLLPAPIVQLLRAPLLDWTHLNKRYYRCPPCARTALSPVALAGQLPLGLHHPLKRHWQPSSRTLAQVSFCLWRVEYPIVATWQPLTTVQARSSSCHALDPKTRPEENEPVHLEKSALPFASLSTREYRYTGVHTVYAYIYVISYLLFYRYRRARLESAACRPSLGPFR